MNEIETQILALFDGVAYAMRDRLGSGRPGGHRSTGRGSGVTFADTAPLMRHPDPRRLDFRRSLLDPFGDIHVRRYETLTNTTVYIVVDLSQSLAVRGASDRQSLAALSACALAQGAYRSHDHVALALSKGAEGKIVLPAARNGAVASRIKSLISEEKPAGTGVDGLVMLADEIPDRRTAVFVISDYEFSIADAARLCTAFQGHAWRPILLSDSAFDRPDPTFGLTRLYDPELARKRMVLMRPALARAQQETRKRHRRALDDLFSAHGVVALEICDQIVVEDFVTGLSEYPI